MSGWVLAYEVCSPSRLSLLCQACLSSLVLTHLCSFRSGAQNDFNTLETALAMGSVVKRAPFFVGLSILYGLVILGGRSVGKE